MDGLQAWRAWRTWLRAGSSDDTVRGYAGNVLRFLAETGCQDPGSYTEQDCAAFLADFAPRGAARRAYANALRSFFGWCLNSLVIAVSPMDHVRIRKPRQVAPVVLTYDELVRLLVAAVFVLGERPSWALLLVYLLGLRRKEAAGLEWAHILETPDGPVIEIRETKGTDQREPLPLSPLALECLARLKELEPPPQARRGPEYVIRAERATISEWVHRAGTAAELPARKIGSHRLRASVATHMLRAGVDVRVVQQALGHVRLESTAWYLAAADGDEVRAALEVVGRVARAG